MRAARVGQRGATYLALMVLIAVVSAVLAATAEILSHAQRREREKQLLWVGDQYRRAIAEYSKRGAGVDTFPRSLQDLLEDKRQTVPVNHLRRLYFDPITASTDWGLVRNPQERIIGVYSKSSLAPIRTDNFPPIYARFRRATTYADWKFAVGELPPGQGGDAAAPGQPGQPVVPGDGEAPGNRAGTPGSALPAGGAPTPRIGGIAAPPPAAAPAVPTPAAPVPAVTPSIFTPGILTPLPGGGSPLSPATPAAPAAPSAPATPDAKATPSGTATPAGRTQPGGATAAPAASPPAATEPAPAAEGLPPGDDAVAPEPEPVPDAGTETPQD